MVRNHLKILNAPRTWKVNRKERKFIIKPNCGAGSFRTGLPLNHVLKNEIRLTDYSKESRHLLFNNGCLVNGRVVKDGHYLVGFLDVISFPQMKKSYRVVFNSKGYLSLHETDEKEAGVKICKIIGKTKLHGAKIQVNTLDGRNFLVEKDAYRTSDSIMVQLPSQKVVKHLPMKVGCTIILIGGKHLGAIGRLENVEGRKIFFAKDESTYETLKEFAFVLGQEKVELKIR